MSFVDCINEQVGTKDKKGFLTEKQSKELIEEYETLFEKYRHTLGDDAAAHTAAEHYVNIKQKQILQKVENDVTQVLTTRRLQAEMEAKGKEYDADKDHAATWGKFLYGNGYARAVREKLQFVYTRQKSIERQAHADIAEAVEKFRSKAAGFKQDTAGFIDVVRELGGTSTGNDIAATFGKSIRGVFDDLHKKYQDAGGLIGKLDNYFPQVHRPELVKRASFEEWRDTLMPLLDRERMIDPETAMPMDGQTLNRAMRNAYDSIITNGRIEIARRAKDGKQTFGRGGDISARHSSSRFFHFKDVDSFLEYNREFGLADEGLFDAVMGHISTMSRDIAIMQELGPKANAFMRNVEMTLEGKEVKVGTQEVIDGMYRTLTGATSYNGALPGWYKFMAGWIDIKRSAYLGTAPVSAMADTYFIGKAAKMNGLSGTKSIGRYLSMLNPKNQFDRDLARMHFFVSSAANGMSLQGARFADDMGRNGMTSFLAGVTHRLSGLSTMTDVGRAVLPMEMAGNLALHAKGGRAWNDLPDFLRDAMEANNITSKDWDVMSRAKMTYIDETDVNFLMPEDIAAMGENALPIANKLSDWYTRMGDLAVNEPTLLTRAITTGAVIGSGKAGSGSRFAAANIFFAKSFPVTVMINHTIPAFRDAAQGRMGPLLSVALGSALFGALSLQTRQVITGKDPRDMSDVNFWVQAELQGGGLGMFGDFLFADYNRFGQGLGSALLGPVAGSLENIIKIGDLDTLGTDADLEKMLADTWKIANREIPVVRLWYTRLVLERMLLDQVEKSLDPGYDKRMRRIERRMQKQTGQQWWWEPGEATPDRAPNLSTAIGE